MFQTQIALGILVFGIVLLALTWIIQCTVPERQEYKEPQAPEVPEVSPPDEKWWRDIFEYYD